VFEPSNYDITVYRGATFREFFFIENDELTITSVSATNPAIVTTSKPHLFNTSDVVNIRECNAFAGILDINREWTITVLSATTFSVGINVTQVGTKGTCARAINIQGWTFACNIKDQTYKYFGNPGVVASVAINSNEVLLEGSHNLEVGDMISIQDLSATTVDAATNLLNVEVLAIFYERENMLGDPRTDKSYRYQTTTYQNSIKSVAVINKFANKTLNRAKVIRANNLLGAATVNIENALAGKFVLEIPQATTLLLTPPRQSLNSEKGSDNVYFYDIKAKYLDYASRATIQPLFSGKVNVIPLATEVVL
jgi:hypothetical protein